MDPGSLASLANSQCFFRSGGFCARRPGYSAVYHICRKVVLRYDYHGYSSQAKDIYQTRYRDFHWYHFGLESRCRIFIDLCGISSG